MSCTVSLSLCGYVLYPLVLHIGGSLSIVSEMVYIYAFSRRFYPKRLTVHSGDTFFFVSMFDLSLFLFSIVHSLKCKKVILEEAVIADVVLSGPSMPWWVSGVLD